MRDFLFISVTGGLLILALVAWLVRNDLAAEFGPVVARWTAVPAPDPAPGPGPAPEAPRTPREWPAPVPPPVESVGTAPTLRPQASLRRPQAAETAGAPAYDPAVVTRVPDRLARTYHGVDGERRVRVEARAFGASRWSEADLRRRAEAVCAALLTRLPEGGVPVFRIDAQVGPPRSNRPIPVTVANGACARVPAPPAPVPVVLSPKLRHLPVTEMATWRYGGAQAYRIAVGGGGPLTRPEAEALCRALLRDNQHDPRGHLGGSLDTPAMIISRGGRDHVLSIRGAGGTCTLVAEPRAYGPRPG